MGQPTYSPTAEYALRLGDDALIHSHRTSEWCTQAPLLEEDVALLNIGLDYLGRARLLLQYAGELTGQTEDQLAFLRDVSAYKNLLMLELPRGDFAFAVCRHYLVDVFDQLFYAELRQSKNVHLASIAEKACKEIQFHLRRSEGWIRRLGLGTEESHQRMQTALDDLADYVDEFFFLDDLEQTLVDDGVAVDRSRLEASFHSRVAALLGASSLELPRRHTRSGCGRAGIHTEHLGYILAELQFMQRAYPNQSW